MLYWLPNSAASAARLYWEMTQAGWSAPATVGQPDHAGDRVHHVAERARQEVAWWLERRYSNVIYFSELQAGGHFAVLEQPTGFVGDVRATFRLLR